MCSLENCARKQAGEGIQNNVCCERLINMLHSRDCFGLKGQSLFFFRSPPSQTSLLLFHFYLSLLCASSYIGRAYHLVQLQCSLIVHSLNEISPHPPLEYPQDICPYHQLPRFPHILLQCFLNLDCSHVDVLFSCSALASLLQWCFQELLHDITLSSSCFCVFLHFANVFLKCGVLQLFSERLQSALRCHVHGKVHTSPCLTHTVFLASVPVAAIPLHRRAFFKSAIVRSWKSYNYLLSQLNSYFHF